MTLDKKFQEKYKKLKEKFYRIEKKTKDKTVVEEIFYHEVANGIQMVRGINTMEEMGMPEEAEKVKKRAQQIINEMFDLYPVTEIEDFSKKGLTSQTQTNLYDLFTDKAKSIKNQYGIKTNITGDKNAYTNLNNTALKALISTNMRDATKWSPKDEKIEINIKNKQNKIDITLENKFTDTPTIPEIGLGKKIGTRYTTGFIEAIKGIFTQKKTKGSPYNTFKKTFILPKK